MRASELLSQNYCISFKAFTDFELEILDVLEILEIFTRFIFSLMKTQYCQFKFSVNSV